MQNLRMLLLASIVIFGFGKIAGQTTTVVKTPTNNKTNQTKLKLPNPQIADLTFSPSSVNSAKPSIEVSFFTKNYRDFPETLFETGSGLPPCGESKTSSRIWVAVYDAVKNKPIYGFCNITKTISLRKMSFPLKREDLPKSIYVVWTNRETNESYVSNCLNADNSSCDAKNRPLDFKPDFSNTLLYQSGQAPQTMPDRKEQNTLANSTAKIQNAYQTGYGRKPTAVEVGKYLDAVEKEKWNEDQIVSKIMAYLGDQPDAAKWAEMKAIVERAYKAAGITPDQANLDNWTNRIVMQTANYSTILKGIKFI